MSISPCLQFVIFAFSWCILGVFTISYCFLRSFHISNTVSQYAIVIQSFGSMTLRSHEDNIEFTMSHMSLRKFLTILCLGSHKSSVYEGKLVLCLQKLLLRSVPITHNSCHRISPPWSWPRALPRGARSRASVVQLWTVSCLRRPWWYWVMIVLLVDAVTPCELWWRKSIKEALMAMYFLELSWL